ncbi:cysteine desulfurase [Alkalibaculum bacchi]|uniref:Cysteine desulfurase n=1 Tax=Alkalibaculum bacchi TaxID=645887 RepID=A0A366I927_9FIRM|nr:cysteine desulfurase family protein [Alkalibaculum bacchi]RBP65960.1 cysteine desulfurase [Alkalibaculum bacchi]
MIYLDYAAETPVDPQVLNTFNEVSIKYIANPNSTHSLGTQAKERLEHETGRISKLLHVKPSEIIYTSSASESNNLAIKGIVERYKTLGKHIITTYLEHSSVNGPMGYLKDRGYEIDYVDILPNGLVDLEHLKELLREDTILVSICYVDSEVGIIQDMNKLGELIKAYPNCHLHTDGTQAVGKIPLFIKNIDMITFAPHKFYGLNGSGILIKKEHIELEPMIHGGISTTPYRSGTPSLALIAATGQALETAFLNVESRHRSVSKLNNDLRTELKKLPKVEINSPEQASPYILNISLLGIKAEKIVQALDLEGICLSSKSACCAMNTPSRPVYALTNNRKRALSTLRISLSHLTTEEEINRFMSCLKNILEAES